MEVLWNMDGKPSKLRDFLATLVVTNRLVKWRRGGAQITKIPHSLGLNDVAIRVCNYCLQVYITGEISAIR